jgi:hypothetical protein
MNQEEVIEVVNAAIRSRMPDGDPARLAIAERPRLANCMVWSICESTKGTWWEAKVDDATGELVSLLRKGLR